MILRATADTWGTRAGALAHLGEHPDAGSVEQCAHCRRWYLSVLLTPAERDGDCGREPCYNMRGRHRRTDRHRRPTSPEHHASIYEGWS